MIGPKFEDERSQTRSVSFVKWEHVYLTCKIIKNMWRPNIMHVLTILCTAPRAGTGGGVGGGETVRADKANEVGPQSQGVSYG